jgi:formamidopyrimidine-DNA glycosylase
MIEFPETAALAAQLRSALTGETVARVLPPTKPHKFCWFAGDPAEYDGKLRGCRVASAEGFGSFAELVFEGGPRLCVNDGVNLRLNPGPLRDYQLLIRFESGAELVFTVAMYGGIYLHNGEYENEYYLKSRSGVSPLSPEFEAAFRSALETAKPTLSAKAFLATEQRFPGLGNGVLQDILFAAGVHPKRKLAALGAEEREKLLACTVSVLSEMTRLGGRDTEKDLYGQPGGYRTLMSKSGQERGCPVCGGPICKEAYMGGSVYFCPVCQPLPEKTK